MKKIFLMAFILSACAHPQTKEEFRPFAKEKLDHIEFKVTNTTWMTTIERLRAYAHECIKEVKEVRNADFLYTLNRGKFEHYATHVWVIDHKAQIEFGNEKISFFVQQDIGSMVGTPEGGPYVLMTEISKVSEKEQTGVTYFFDHAQMRFRDLATRINTAIKTGKKVCPDLSK